MNNLTNKKIMLAVLLFAVTILAVLLVFTITETQRKEAFAQPVLIEKTRLASVGTVDLGNKTIPKQLSEDNIFDYVRCSDFLIEVNSSKIYNGKQYSYYVRRTAGCISFYFFNIEYKFFNNSLDYSVDFKCINEITFSYTDLKDNIIIERDLSNKLVLSKFDLVESIMNTDLREPDDKYYIQTRYSSDSISKLKTATDVLSGMSYVLSVDSLLLAATPAGNYLSVASMFFGDIADRVLKKSEDCIINDTAKDYPQTRELQYEQYGETIKSIELSPFESSDGYYLSKGDNLKCYFRTISDENVNSIYVSDFKLTFGYEEDVRIRSLDEIELKNAYTSNAFSKASEYVLQDENVITNSHTYLIPNANNCFYEYIPEEDGYYSFDDYISIQNAENTPLGYSLKKNTAYRLYINENCIVVPAYKNNIIYANNCLSDDLSFRELNIKKEQKIVDSITDGFNYKELIGNENRLCKMIIDNNNSKIEKVFVCDESLNIIYTGENIDNKYYCGFIMLANKKYYLAIEANDQESANVIIEDFDLSLTTDIQYKKPGYYEFEGKYLENNVSVNGNNISIFRVYNNEIIQVHDDVISLDGNEKIYIKSLEPQDLCVSYVFDTSECLERGETKSVSEAESVFCFTTPIFSNYKLNSNNSCDVYFGGKLIYTNENEFSLHAGSYYLVQRDRNNQFGISDIEYEVISVGDETITDTWTLYSVLNDDDLGFRIDVTGDCYVYDEWYKLIEKEHDSYRFMANSRIYIVANSNFSISRHIEPMSIYISSSGESLSFNYGEDYVIPFEEIAGKQFNGWFVGTTRYTDEHGHSLNPLTENNLCFYAKYLNKTVLIKVSVDDTNNTFKWWNGDNGYVDYMPQSGYVIDFAVFLANFTTEYSRLDSYPGHYFTRWNPLVETELNNGIYEYTITPIWQKEIYSVCLSNSERTLLFNLTYNDMFSSAYKEIILNKANLKVYPNIDIDTLTVEFGDDLLTSLSFGGLVDDLTPGYATGPLGNFVGAQVFLSYKLKKSVEIQNISGNLINNNQIIIKQDNSMIVNIPDYNLSEAGDNYKYKELYLVIIYTDNSKEIKYSGEPISWNDLMNAEDFVLTYKDVVLEVLPGTKIYSTWNGSSFADSYPYIVNSSVWNQKVFGRMHIAKSGIVIGWNCSITQSSDSNSKQYSRNIYCDDYVSASNIVSEIYLYTKNTKITVYPSSPIYGLDQSINASKNSTYNLSCESININCKGTIVQRNIVFNIGTNVKFIYFEGDRGVNALFAWSDIRININGGRNTPLYVEINSCYFCGKSNSALLCSAETSQSVYIVLNNTRLMGGETTNTSAEKAVIILSAEAEIGGQNSSIESGLMFATIGSSGRRGIDGINAIILHLSGNINITGGTGYTGNQGSTGAEGTWYSRKGKKGETGGKGGNGGYGVLAGMLVFDDYSGTIQGGRGGKGGRGGTGGKSYKAKSSPGEGGDGGAGGFGCVAIGAQVKTGTYSNATFKQGETGQKGDVGNAGEN